MNEPIREIRVTTDVWPGPDCEIRTEGDGMTFSGYAAVFNRDSEPMTDFGFGMPFVERIDPAAFSRTLKRDQNIRMFLNHNTDSLLATRKAGTLRLDTDGVGLLATANLPNTNLGRDTAELVKRGDITSMSFGFIAVRADMQPAGKLWEPAPGTEKMNQRLLQECRLLEVSPVTGWPAYPDTSAAVRHLAEEAEVEPDVLASAFSVLRDQDGKLTAEQRSALLAAINARYESRVVSSDVAEWRARLASKDVSA